MTINKLMEQTENSIEAAKKAIINMEQNADKLQEMMESRTSKVIKWAMEIPGLTREKAIKDLLGMGYTKSEIRECGYDVD